MDPYQSPKSQSLYSYQGKISGLLLFERAVRELVRHRKVILIGSTAPILISSSMHVAGIAYFQSFEPGVNGMWEMWFIALGMFWLSVPFFVMFATNCHRIILLGEDALPNMYGLYWSWNETRFLGWLVVLGIIAALASIPLHALPAVIDWFDIYQLPIWPFSYLSLLVSTYFEGRFGLVLPATAVGERRSLRESWQITGRVGWAVFFALLIPIAITELVEFVVFRQLIDSTSLVVYFFEATLFYPLVAVGVAVLTIVYRDREELTRES